MTRARAWAPVLLGVVPLLAAVPTATAGGVAHPQRWPRASSGALVDARRERQITRWLAHLTLEEKVGQVIQADIDSIHPQDLRRYPLGSILVGGDPAPGGDPLAPPSAWLALTRSFDRNARDGTGRAHAPIPLLKAIDAAHGIGHVRGATIFPQAIGLGATHDPELIRAIGAATAQEAAALGFNWIFAPSLSVPEDVRWGRTYEAYSSDPELVRRFAAAMVSGVQGEADAPVAATAKHFIGDGATSDGIDQGDAAVEERHLIDVDAPAYVAAIDAGVLTVMASYSSWQGAKMHGNRTLLTDVLKRRLGFEGLVLGDWNGHNQLEECSSGSCPQAFNAGLDMFMAPDAWQSLYEQTLAQVRSGQIPPARLDAAVRRVLRVKYRLELFDAQPRVAGRLELLGSEVHRALARRAVRESLVLLKNEGDVLPIRGDARILLAGVGADDIGQQCGGWTLSWQGAVHHNADFVHAQSIYAGLLDSIATAGGSVELSADGRYGRRPDVAVVVYGEAPYAEKLGDRSDLTYDDPPTLALLQRLQADGIPIVSVFLSGRPRPVEPLLALSDAFVAAWLPGAEGGGIADVIVGGANGAPRADFTGRLSYAWPPGWGLGFGLHYAH